MTVHHDNFRAWYVDILEMLNDHHEAAGFAILMITFPLLERYLTNKVASTPQTSASSNGRFDELLNIFPELHDRATASSFWNAYRDSLLHNVSLSRPNTRSSNQPAVAWVTHDRPGISIDSDGSFWINPVDISKRVLHAIEDDFPTFEGAKHLWQLPTVQTNQDSTKSGPVVVGTRGDLNS